MISKINYFMGLTRSDHFHFKEYSLQYTLGCSKHEAVCVLSLATLNPLEASFLIYPFLGSLTKSEIVTLMAAAMASQGSVFLR